MEFQYCMPTRVVCGADNIEKLDALFPAGAILIVADPIMAKIGVTERVQKILGSRKTEVFTEVEPNPSFETADRAAALARGIDAVGVVGIGGGSSLDVAKAASMLCTNEGSIEEYIVGGKKLENKRCFLICVPTTAGTGSEVSNVGVFTDHKAHTKRPWVSFDFLPDIALLDPVMTYSLPPRVTVATGLDALCHAVESYWCRATNPITKSAAIMSAKLVLENLMTAFNEPKNVEARTNMCVASLLGGLAMGQTRTTACHGISYGLTTNFGIDHGTACALTLPEMIRLFYPAVKDEMDTLVKMIGCESAEDFACRVEGMMDAAGIHRNLSAYGIKESDLPELAHLGMIAPVTANSPMDLTEADVYEALRNIL